MSIPKIAKDGLDVPAGVKAEKQPINHVTGSRFAGGEVARTALPESGWERSSRGLRSAPPSGPREPSGVYDREPPPGVSDRTPAS
jgi:hypothetical protein